MKLIIQIPCYNEEKTIADTLQGIPKQIPGIDEVRILLIDDGSSDETVRVGLENGADYVVRHPANQGLARAFITGIQTSLALGADMIVNTDADNQYPGKYIPDLIQPILEKMADISIGDRQVVSNQYFSPLKRALEVLGTWVMRKISRTDVQDAASGFRAYSRYAAIRLKVYSSYSYTLETLIQAGNERMRIAHFPIITNAATRESRLHKGMFNFMWRQAETIIRSYVLYQPLSTFTMISLPFLLSFVILISRFFYFYFTEQSGIGRHVQSVSIGGTLGVLGLILLMLGLLGDAIRANRQISDEILISQRARFTMSETDREIMGYPFISKSK